MSELNSTKVLKTNKLFIGGEFPRTESGRSFPIYIHKSKKVYAQLCQASRKDLRNAVTAAQSALPGWSGKSAYNRGQIVYRMAEMLESKRGEFVDVLVKTNGLTKQAAEKSVSQTIDSLVYYAGWSDKYQQVIGAVNPVSGPHHNFTTPEPVGIVGMVSEKEFSLTHFVSRIASIIISGNCLIALMPEKGGAFLPLLAEVFATSDLSKGVINLLTGHLSEIGTYFGSHMEIHSLSLDSPKTELTKALQISGADNMKRICHYTGEPQNLENLLQFIEFKTVWHPIGV